MMLLGESGQVSVADLNHLVADKIVATQQRARRAGEQIGRIAAALKPRSEAFIWNKNQPHERIFNTGEVKLEKYFSGWLDLVAHVEDDATIQPPEWLDYVTQAELVVNKFELPFDDLQKLSDEELAGNDAPSEFTVIRFTPIQKPQEDAPFPPCHAAYDKGQRLEALEAYESEIAIGVLYKIAEHVEAQAKAASA